MRYAEETSQQPATGLATIPSKTESPLKIKFRTALPKQIRATPSRATPKLSFYSSEDDDRSPEQSTSTSSAKVSVAKNINILNTNASSWPLDLLPNSHEDISASATDSAMARKHYLERSVQKSNIENHFRGSLKKGRVENYRNHGREFTGCGIIPAYGQSIKTEEDYAHFASWYLRNHQKLGAEVIKINPNSEDPRVAYYHSKGNLLLILVDKNGEENVSNDFITFFRPELDRMETNRPFLSFSGVGDSYVASSVRKTLLA